MELVSGWAVARKWGWVGLVGLVATSYCYCSYCVCLVGRLRWSCGCCSCCNLVVGIVVVGVGLMPCILEVVARVVVGVGLCTIVVVCCRGVVVGNGCVCVVDGRGCVVWACVGCCRLVVGIVAVGVFVAGGAASFLGACQKMCVVGLELPPRRLEYLG